MPDININNLFGVIPGIIGLWAYNRWLNTTRPQAEGWAYLFAVVIFAMPSYYIFEISPVSESFKCFSDGKCGFIKFLLELILSILLAIMLGRLSAYIRNKSKSSLDPFHGCCYLWRNQIVYITLKNDKVYVALLLDYTKDLRFEPTIRIVPICSGYRDRNKEVNWSFNYPEEYLSKTIDDSQEKLKIGTIISQKEIMTFSLWDESITNISDIYPSDHKTIDNPV